jgi:hypothetical protein
MAAPANKPVQSMASIVKSIAIPQKHYMMSHLTGAITGSQKRRSFVVPLLAVRVHGVVSRSHARVLPFVRRYDSDCSSELCMSDWINRPMLDLGTRWVFAKIVVAFPVLRRSDWPGNKATATIGTDIPQNSIDAGDTKRTFIATNACLKRIGRQRLVAVFARWAEFEHSAFPL